MSKEIKETLLKRLDFNEERIRKSLTDIAHIRQIIMSDEKETKFDIIRLLGDEKYRIVKALEICKKREDTANLLGMTERTLYRKLKHYKLN